MQYELEHYLVEISTSLSEQGQKLEMKLYPGCQCTFLHQRVRIERLNRSFEKTKSMP